MSFKKYLSDLPKQVISSIKHNVASTMETETKTLKEDLLKALEILS